MTVTCPEGHQSEATDYCDTCGSPIAAGAGSGGGPSGGLPGGGLPGGGPLGGVGGVPPGGPSPGGVAGSVLDLDPAEQVATITCPHCGGVNLADALFCEACGYDFTTGTPPPDDEPAPVVDEPETDEPEVLAAPSDQSDVDGARVDQPDVQDPDAEPEPDGQDFEELDREPDSEEPGDGPASGELDEPEGQDSEELDREPDSEEPGHGPASEELEEPTSTEEPDEESLSEGPDVAEPESAADVSPPPAPEAPPAHARPRHTPPSRALADAWVVEVWVDPDWYAVQQTEEACPSAGVPDIVVVRRNVVLVGRPSGSLGVRPDVDAGADSAVSRRHAQLTSDGRRWWIEDLGSSNGTFVGVVGEPLPTQPITPGVRVEIDRDDRIYIGAWTRLVLRQATASEQAGQG